MAKVLVTGARRGIGLATVIELARRGHRVVAGTRRPDQIGELESLASRAGVSIEPVVLDLTDPRSIADAGSSVTADGVIDVVVNNAGVFPVGPTELTDVKVMRETFDTNVVGPMLLAQAVLPTMRRQGRGLFVTVSSGARHPRVTPPTFGLIYAASKAAEDCWAESFNKEIAGFGLRSIVVELGGFDTDMTQAERFAAAVVSAESPYAAVAVVQDEALRRAPRLPATDAARCIADLVESPLPPIRTVLPAELAALIASASQISDDDYIAHCQTASGRDWARAFQQSLTRKSQ